MTDGPSTEPLLDRLDAIASAIAVARDTVADGGGVDLSGLEAEVRAVCTEITTAAAADNRDQLETSIRAVLGDLDALAASLSDQHRRALAAAGLNDAARTAYGAPPPGVGDPDESGGAA